MSDAEKFLFKKFRNFIIILKNFNNVITTNFDKILEINQRVNTSAISSVAEKGMSIISEREGTGMLHYCNHVPN